MERTFTIFEKRHMKDRIEALTDEGKMEIYNIIKDEKYSENKNHIMFDLAKISDNILVKLDKFLTFTENNIKNLELEEVERDKYRNELT